MEWVMDEFWQIYNKPPWQPLLFEKGLLEMAPSWEGVLPGIGPPHTPLVKQRPLGAVGLQETFRVYWWAPSLPCMHLSPDWGT